MTHENSLANLQPPWQKGERGGVFRSREVNKAITQLRRAAPEAVELCLAVMRDPNENSKLRAQIAMAIINKVIPDQKDGSSALDSRGIQSLQIEFVSGETMTIDRQQQPRQLDEPPGDVIDVAFEPSK